MALPPRDQRHPYLRFEGLEYTDADIADFEERLGKGDGCRVSQHPLSFGYVFKDICFRKEVRGDSIWRAIASGPERQPYVTAGAQEVAKGAPDVNKGGQRDVLDCMACDFSKFTTWKVSSLSLIMDHARVSSVYTAYSLYDTAYSAELTRIDTVYRKIWSICACTSQETAKIQSIIRHIQETSIRRIQDKEIKYSGRYRTWSLLQETLDTSKDSVARSRLRRKQSSKRTSESKTEASKSKNGQSDKENQSCSAKDKSPSHPLASTPVVAEMHKDAHQPPIGLTSLGATSEEGAHPQLSSGTNLSVLVDETKYVEDELKISHTDIGTNKESRSDEIPKKIKLEDLSNLMQDTRSSFFTPNSPWDEPMIVSDESEEEDTERYEDTHATSYNELEDTSIPHHPSPKLRKDKEVMSSKDVKEEETESDSEDEHANPADFMIESSKKKKLNQFSFVTEYGEQIHLTDVKIEEQKRIEESLKAKLSKQEVEKVKDKLVDLMGTDVVTQYYNKLMYDKYYDKMLKRRKSSEITNCDVLTKKGPITLKVYRKDETNEVISKFKVSDLHLAK
uniref:Uncharacterized protein n=1 Tax=Tanacetum cinerariifolium TaxID=118510 RepID=A0A6L2KKS6_TANCI|nr:hypothetical protein [Tanacetum cinerariifolium]